MSTLPTTYVDKLGNIHRKGSITPKDAKANKSINSIIARVKQANPTTAGGEDAQPIIDELRSQVTEANKKFNDAQATASNNTTKLTNAEAEIKRLGDNLSSVSADLKTKTEELVGVNAELKGKNNELGQVITDLNKAKGSILAYQQLLAKHNVKDTTTKSVWSWLGKK